MNIQLLKKLAFFEDMLIFIEIDDFVKCFNLIR